MATRDKIAARKARVRELFLVGRMPAKDIAERLLAEGVMRSRSFDSAYRLIRADVEELRTTLTVEDILALDDEVEFLRFLEIVNKMLDVAMSELGRDTSKTQTVTEMLNAKGKKIGSQRTARITDRGKEKQQLMATILSLLKERAAVTNALKRKGAPAEDPGAGVEPFLFRFDNVPFDDMVAHNLGTDVEPN
ncbi:MAG TPA: hypothetical protein VMO47_09120 [Rhodothermales bacterium]|nr:hypothetical protein [Rhodothermales bacterium]